MRPRSTGNSLCLFCSIAPNCRPSPFLHLSRPQIAHRSTNAAKERRNVLRFTKNSSSKTLQPDTDTSGVYTNIRDNRFKWLVERQLNALHERLSKPKSIESVGLDSHTFDTQWQNFKKVVFQWIRTRSSEYTQLRKASLVRGGDGNIDRLLQHRFYSQIFRDQFSKAELLNHKELANLRYPFEWFPATRSMRRAVHLHVGPTNSGKTYHALKRLEAAESGIYLGPLRLLAHEVYSRLNAKGIKCCLITGEEQRVPEGEVNMYSCTVEMAPLNRLLDVAIIDEIQMVAHEERGWAWTQAFLGLQAKEIHLCGEARAVPIIRELCALNGDEIEVHEYERLSPLEVADRSLEGKWTTKLEKGDCVVAFSVTEIHSLRHEIEKKTGRKVAIVYGSLPPETRAQQARLFNDPDNDYDFLVASDAVGMGLNLSIKRLIFESTAKVWKGQVFPLQVSELKQIAGRAGRYRSAHEAMKEDESTKARDLSTASETSIADTTIDPVVGLDVKPAADLQSIKSTHKTAGYVTTLMQQDFKYLQETMAMDAEPIRSVGLFPPSLIVERFATYFPPGTPFSYILTRLHEISDLHSRFFLCGLKDQLTIADIIQPVRSLSISDRLTICASPATPKDPIQIKNLISLAECIGDEKSGAFLDIPNLPLEVLDEEPTANRHYLYRLEILHKMIILYLWLSFRFPNVFISRKLADHTKRLVETAIETTLSKLSWSEQRRERMALQRAKKLKKLEEQQRHIALEEEEERLRQEQLGFEAREKSAENAFQNPPGEPNSTAPTEEVRSVEGATEDAVEEDTTLTFLTENSEFQSTDNPAPMDYADKLTNGQGEVTPSTNIRRDEMNGHSEEEEIKDKPSSVEKKVADHQVKLVS